MSSLIHCIIQAKVLVPLGEYGGESILGKGSGMRSPAATQLLERSAGLFRSATVGVAGPSKITQRQSECGFG